MPEVLPSTFVLRLWQGRYCEGEEYASCARLLALRQGQPVPAGMLPSGNVLATAG